MERLRCIGIFIRRVLRDFQRNKGLLIAGALGYNTLLSVVPLFALILVALSHLVADPVLIEAVQTQVAVVFPGQAEALTMAFVSFLDKRELISGVGLLIMLLFSTIAFRMLEDAMQQVFRRTKRPRSRHWTVTALLPFAYVALIGLGVLLMTLVMIAFDMLPEQGIRLLGARISSELAVPLVKFLAFLGLVALLSSFYYVMPKTSIAPKRAMVGGLVAGSLWEAVRSVTTWYFANLSMVDLVYDSLSAVVVVLVSLEIAAIIVLLGAEVIAALERSAEHDLPWWEAPADEELAPAARTP